MIWGFLMAQRANVLRAYRELIDLAKRLPSAKRDVSVQEARNALRTNRNESDPVKQSDMLKELVAKVSFLRMTTPKTYRDRSSSYSLQNCTIAHEMLASIPSRAEVTMPCRRTRHGFVTYVLRDGVLVESQGKSESRCAGYSSALLKYL